MNIEENRKYKDFIDYTPELIRYIDKEESKIISKYSIIMKALHEKNMTVKEIHNLYFDDEIKKHTCTLKTIYRYLERLEETDFVTVAGHRMTKGSRQTEKIYSRSARILLAKKDEEYDTSKREHRNKIANNIAILLNEVFDKSELESEKFNKLMIKLMDSNHKITNEIFDELQRNETLANLYAHINLDEINIINIYGMFLITILKNYKLVEAIKEIYV